MIALFCEEKKIVDGLFKCSIGSFSGSEAPQVCMMGGLIGELSLFLSNLTLLKDLPDLPRDFKFILTDFLNSQEQMEKVIEAIFVRLGENQGQLVFPAPQTFIESI